MSGKSKGKPIGIGAVIAIVVGVVVALQQGVQEKSNPGGQDAAVRPAGPASVQPRDVRGPDPDFGSTREAPAAHVPDTTKPDTTVRIGAWNIEWLGKPSERSGLGQGTAQAVDDLVDYIIAARVSLLAVEEIIGRPAADGPRSPELDAVVSQLKSRTGQVWRYELFPGRSDDAQLTGLMWDGGVATPLDRAGKPEKGDPTPTKLPVKSGKSTQGSGLWNRPPHAMYFSLGSGKTDLVLIVVHMKADYQGDFAAHRDEEAKTLVDALPGVRKTFSDQDVVVLGDTNMTRPDEAAGRTFVGSGMHDLNRKAETTHWRGGATDRIFVPEAQSEFAERKFEVMSDQYLEAKRWDPRDFKRGLSDHYMVVTTIRVMEDDD